MIKHIAFTATALITLAMAILIFILPQPKNGETLAGGETALYISNVSLMQAGGMKFGQTLKIDNGRIAQIAADITPPETSRTIDGTGMTVLPGLMDAHTHSYGTAVSDALKFGVTANLDMFSSLTDLKSERTSREATKRKTQSDLFSAGMMATAPGGHGTQYGVPITPLDGPEDAIDWVKARKAEGSDFIKLVYMPYQTRIPTLSRETAKAVIDAAHAEDLMALAHISTQQAARDMIEDNIDGLVHIFADSEAMPELVEQAAEKNVFIIPTLAVIASVDGQSKDLMSRLSDDSKSRLSPMQRQTLSQSFPGLTPGYSFETALKNVERFHDGGVVILAGSDAPNPGTAHGISLHLEMQHLVKAGFTPDEAIAAATTLPVNVFGLEKRGTVSVGARADLILIAGNPYEQISDSLNIRHIIKNGFVMDGKKKAPKTAKTFVGNALSDFSTGLSAGSDLTWTPTDDGMANGKSKARVQIEGDHLKVSGEARTGFPFPWAGASIAINMNGSGINISRFSSIRFDVKGTPGTYRLMSFHEGAPGIPPSLNFEITDAWTTIELTLADLAGFEPEIFTGFAIVAGPDPLRFEFFLRDVSLQE